MKIYEKIYEKFMWLNLLYIRFYHYFALRKITEERRKREAVVAKWTDKIDSMFIKVFSIYFSKTCLQNTILLYMVGSGAK